MYKVNLKEKHKTEWGTWPPWALLGWSLHLAFLGDRLSRGEGEGGSLGLYPRKDSTHVHFVLCILNYLSID